MGIRANLNIVGQYHVIYKASLAPVLCNLSLGCFSKIDWDSYVYVEYPLSSYHFAIRNAYSLPPSRDAKRLRSGSQQIDLNPGRDMVWLPGLAYASKESNHSDWSDANRDVATNKDPMKGEVPSVGSLDMDDHSSLLEKMPIGLKMSVLSILFFLRREESSVVNVLPSKGQLFGLTWRL